FYWFILFFRLVRRTGSKGLTLLLYLLGSLPNIGGPGGRTCCTTTWLVHSRTFSGGFFIGLLLLLPILLLCSGTPVLLVAIFTGWHATRILCLLILGIITLLRGATAAFATTISSTATLR